MLNCFVFQDAALVAMRKEVVAEITKLRNQELEQAQQELRQQLQQQVPLHLHVACGNSHFPVTCVWPAPLFGPCLSRPYQINAASGRHAHTGTNGYLLFDNPPGKARLILLMHSFDCQNLHHTADN